MIKGLKFFMIWHIFDLEKNEYVKIDVILFLWFGNDIQHILAIIVSFIPFFVFGFRSLLARSCKNMKILHKLCLHFGRQDGQDGEKSRKKITQLK